MKIDEMQAGRELDAMVAEKVMGWKVISFHHCWEMPSGELRTREQTPYKKFSPSADIEAAWEVAECIYQKGAQFSIKIGRPGGWRAWVGLNIGSDATAPTAPLAI